MHLGGVYDGDLHSFLYFKDSDVFWKGCVTDLAYWEHLSFYLMFKGFFINLYAEEVTVNPEEAVDSVSCSALGEIFE